MDFFSVEGRAKECGADKATVAVEKVKDCEGLIRIKIRDNETNDEKGIILNFENLRNFNYFLSALVAIERENKEESKEFSVAKVKKIMEMITKGENEVK